METEQLAIFNEQMQRIGTRSRAEVHAQGLWHQTFQCWFLQSVQDKQTLLFQRRAACKKDFPNLLDITAAGHLLADEEPRDGVREIQEELGLSLKYTELIPAGVIQDQLVFEHFKDREFCHLYFYHLQQDIAELILQKEEVASIVQFAILDCIRLFQHQTTTITGLEYSPTVTGGTLTPSIKDFTLADFCPHNPHYYAQVFAEAQSYSVR